MPASKSPLAKKSNAELATFITSSTAKLLANQEKISREAAEATEILKQRDEKNRRDKDLQDFTNTILETILKSDRKSRLAVRISSSLTPKSVRTNPRYQMVVEALSKKFKVTIKIEHDNGDDYDAGSWGSGGSPSSKAIITFNKEASKPKPQDPVLKALLKQIAQA